MGWTGLVRVKGTLFAPEAGWTTCSSLCTPQTYSLGCASQALPRLKGMQEVNLPCHPGEEANPAASRRDVQVSNQAAERLYAPAEKRIQ